MEHATLTTAALRGKQGDELKTILEALYTQLLNLRFARANGQLENTAQLRQIRRQIARIKTLRAQHRHSSAHKNAHA